MKTKNTEKPDRYSRTEIVEGLKYIASEVGPLMSADELAEEIAKAQLGASRMPAADVAAFKAQVLQRMKRQGESSGGKIIELKPAPASKAVSDRDQDLALAARKRKHSLRKRPNGKRDKGG
jgi:hypothetical protein